MLSWAGIVGLALTWIFLLPYYNPVPWLGWSLFGFGTAASVASWVLSRERQGHGQGFRPYLLCAAPLAVLAAMMPFPESIGLIVLAVGLVLTAAPKRLGEIGNGLAFAGLILTIQAAWLPIHVVLESRYHHLGGLEPLVKLALSAFPLKAAVGGRGILVQTPGYQFSIATTMEKINMLMFALVYLGGLTAILIGGQRVRRTLRQALRLLWVLGAYFGARYLLLLMVFPAVRNMGVFWRPAWVLGTFLPLAFAPVAAPTGYGQGLRVSREVQVVRSEADSALEESVTQGSRRPSMSSRLLVAASCFTLVFAIGFHDPGALKPGRVMIDEYHSNWEKTTEPYTTEWYGEDSGYNYYSLASYMEDYYTVSRNLDSPITPELLATQDVLVLKTPTSAYSQEEIDAVFRFVRQGGGLLLVGDHTNVFGTSTYLNPLAERFGLHFNHDGTYDLATDGLSIYEDRSVFPHPTVRRLGKFMFATSCSLQAPLLSAGAITGYGIKGLYLDYSKENFFRTDAPDFDKDYGLLLQQVALHSGRGRVVAFTDSTVWSNFFMFIPGKWELAEGAFNWLNRRSMLTWAPWALIAVATAGAAALLIRRAKGVPVADPLGVAFALGFAALAILSARGLDSLVYAPPAKIARATTEIAFESEHSNMLIPSETIFIDPNSAYHVFYTWTQRGGARPRMAPLTEAVKCDIVVLANISQSFTSRDLARIKEYVESGGDLLVLHGNGSDDSAANQVLSMFGLAMEDPRDGFIMDLRGGTIQRSVPIYSVAGGTPLLYDSFGRAAAASTGVGERPGRVIVFGASSLLSDAFMGTTSTIPDETIRSIYDLCFYLIRFGKEAKTDHEQTSG
ncbi:MAG: hypothetical protein KA063_03335 [Firmicutes bacterium]|nr:hypothetical protein [Bacillota bacterium]